MKPDFTPRTVTLRDGRTVRLRMAQLSDAEAMIETLRAYVLTTQYIPMQPEEFHPTKEDEEKWIRNFIESPNSILIVAESEGIIVANIDLTGNARKVMQHTAMLGMGIRSEWRGSGLGTALVQHAVDWAKSHPVLTLMWLQVYAGNAAGMQLYKRSGFIEIGRYPGFFKSEVYTDDCVNMYLTLT